MRAGAADRLGAERIGAADLLGAARIGAADRLGAERIGAAVRPLGADLEARPFWATAGTPVANTPIIAATATQR